MLAQMAGNGLHSGLGTMEFSMIGMSLFWILVVLAIFVVFRDVRADSGSGARAKDEIAIDFLKERYACGEIGREEFEKMLRDLER